MRFSTRHLFLFVLAGIFFSLLQPHGLTGANLECDGSNCTKRFVSTEGDAGDGSLRAVLQDSCAKSGDDLIQFLIWRDVQLTRPLALPKDCKGRILLSGKANVRNVIDGSSIEVKPNREEENCLFRVDSDANQFAHLTFVGYTQGSGLCLNGNYNTVENSSVGVRLEGGEWEGNKEGIVIRGSGNRVERSHISQNKTDGIRIRGNRNEIYGNYIGRPRERCGETETLPLSGADAETLEKNEVGGGVNEGKKVEEDADDVPPNANQLGFAQSSPPPGCSLTTGPTQESISETEKKYLKSDCPLESNGGNGIYIEMGSDNIIGTRNEGMHNVLQFNGGAGVRIHQDAVNLKNKVSGNTFYRNKGLGIDTAQAGVNDSNATYPRNVQVFMRELWGGEYKYYFVLQWEPDGENEVEVYLVDGATVDTPLDQQGDPSGFGEGEFLVGHYLVAPQNLFRLELPTGIRRGNKITLLAFDRDGNTSEFSKNLILEKDTDRDGILDIFEDRRGVYNSSPYNADSDGDGLMDSSEDLNKNGIHDEGELFPFLADADEDGLSDYRETRGDGRYNPVEGDTDPFRPDTDCDGLLDGEEDGDANGIVEMKSGETDPRRNDSDGDGVSDSTGGCGQAVVASDNCPHVSNPDQLDANHNGVGDICEIP